jgi:hypothetical protein
LKDAEIKKRNMDNDAACIAQGLFPLASSIEGEEILAQWMRYLMHSLAAILSQGDIAF